MHARMDTYPPRFAAFTLRPLAVAIAAAALCSTGAYAAQGQGPNGGSPDRTTMIITYSNGKISPSEFAALEGQSAGWTGAQAQIGSRSGTAIGPQTMGSHGGSQPGINSESMGKQPGSRSNARSGE